MVISSVSPQTPNKYTEPHFLIYQQCLFDGLIMWFLCNSKCDPLVWVPCSKTFLVQINGANSVVFNTNN